jgi:hypothetical protein
VSGGSLRLVVLQHMIQDKEPLYTVRVRDRVCVCACVEGEGEGGVRALLGIRCVEEGLTHPPLAGSSCDTTWQWCRHVLFGGACWLNDSLCTWCGAGPVEMSACQSSYVIHPHHMRAACSLPVLLQDGVRWSLEMAQALNYMHSCKPPVRCSSMCSCRQGMTMWRLRATCALSSQS